MVNRIPFWYPTGWCTALTASGSTASVTISLGSDMNFEWHYITIQVRQANVLVTNWGGDVQIKHVGLGMELGADAIPAGAIAGDGQTPYVLPTRILLMAGSDILVTFTHNSTTSTQANLTMHGVKIPKGPQ